MSSKRKVWAGTVAFLAVLGASSSVALTEREQEIVDRIKPVGEVCIEGDSSCAAPPAAVAAGPRSGEDVYGTSCLACHDAGVAGAPKTGVASDWVERIAQGEDKLVEHAINGIRGMPPKGTCMTCSDEEIRLAVEYMISRNQ